jgi:hypothetical protein
MGKYNRYLTDDWKEALKILDDKISVINKTIDLEPPRVIVELGGRKFESDSVINKYDRFEWSSPYVRGINPDYNFDLLEVNYLINNDNNF